MHRAGMDRKGPMATGEQYRRFAHDCLKLAEGASERETRAAMLDLAQEWVRLAEQSERSGRYRVAGYRAKACACMALADSVNDPERRADLHTFARLWMSLTEPIEEKLRGAYELPPR
jgi:hypothetical protein